MTRRVYSDYLDDMLHYSVKALKVVWKTVHEDLPALEQSLRKILSG